MLAARVHAWQAVPIVETIPEPVPAPGHSIVRVRAAGVAHLDRSVASGRFVHQPSLPYTPGADGAGVVVESARFPSGATVWVRGGGLGVARDGTCAELVLAPDDAVHECPPEADAALAASFFSPCASAYLALHDIGAVKPGERVAITGAAGAVGSVAVQLSVQAGAGAIVAKVSRAARAVDVPPGATVVVGDQPYDAVDLLIDTVGGPALGAHLERVLPGGRVVLIGYTAGALTQIDVASLIQRDVRLLPLNMIRRQAAAEAIAPTLLDELVSGSLHLEVVRFPLARIADGWELLGSGRAPGRVVVEP